MANEGPFKLSLQEIQRATKMIRPYIEMTPCLLSHFQNTFMMKLYYKTESILRSGNFKERGALYAILRLPRDKQRIGVVIASLGNAAIGLCVHANLWRVPAVVVVPTITTVSKIRACRNLGARVIVQGGNMVEAGRYAEAYARDQNLTYINGRDDIKILAGYGSVAVEILEQVPDVEAVLVPVGFGGLAVAVGTVFKALKPDCLIYGVGIEVMPTFAKSYKAGKPVPTPVKDTMADSLAATLPGQNAWYNHEGMVDKMILVNEDNVARAMLHIVEKERLVVEGAGASPLASIMGNLVPELRLKTVVCILSGGNIDPVFFPRCLERGLAVEGRLIKCQVWIRDTTKSLHELLHLLARAKYSLKRVFATHRWLEHDNYKVEMSLVCQASNVRHAFALKNLLERAYPDNVFFDTHPFNDRGACCCVGRKYPIKWV